MIPNRMHKYHQIWLECLRDRARARRANRNKRFAAGIYSCEREEENRYEERHHRFHLSARRSFHRRRIATLAKMRRRSKKVSPKGPASGMRMLTYYINRGGKGLTDERRAELEKALSKIILSEKFRKK